MAEISSLYIPGVYTTQLLLGNESLDVEVIVDKDSITSIRLVEVSDSVATMYPLLQPTLDSICEQVYAQQSLESVTYTAESKYTSLVLLEGRRGGKPGLDLEPPLALYTPEGAPAKELDRIYFREEALL